MAKQDILQEAIDEALVLTVKYHGGSQPGTIRQISPISISNGKIRAICLSSNAVKTFVIDKIEICSDENEVDKKWNPTHKDKFKYENLNSFIEQNKTDFEKQGWHVNFSENAISLHRSFRNGRILKGPDVSLAYEEYVYEFYIDLDGKECEETKKRKKPWIVSAKGFQGAAYSKLDRAIERFIEQSNALSPNKIKNNSSINRTR